MHKVTDFFFSPVNPKTVIVFRILTAAMLGFIFAPVDLEIINPIGISATYIRYAISQEFYILMYALILLFGLGIKPRIMAFLLVLLLIPHSYFLYEGRKSRQVLITVIFFFTFIKSLPINFLNRSEFAESDYGPMWPIRLIQFQLTLLYLINAIAKSTYPFLSGSVLTEMSVIQGNFLVDLSKGYLEFGKIIIPNYILAISTVLIEYGLAFGLWFRKTKWVTALIGILFHFTLTFVMQIHMLDYISVFLYFSFLLPFSVEKMSSKKFA